jgi:hypothetical protein
MRMANAGMNTVQGDHHGPSMVWVAPVDEGTLPGNSDKDSWR